MRDGRRRGDAAVAPSGSWTPPWWRSPCCSPSPALAPCHKGVTSSSFAKQSCPFPASTSFPHTRTRGIHAPSCRLRSSWQHQVISWSYILQDTPVADSADQTWRGATHKDNVPRSDPPGTVPWAQGLRCPSAPCQVWGGLRCPFGAVPNWGGGYWMPPLAPCRVLRDSPCGTLPAGMGTMQQPGSKLGEVLGLRTRLLPCQLCTAKAPAFP